MQNPKPNKPPLVSVIITCYNHGRYLSTAIESVRSQTYTHHEIVVVDDGSGDNTREVAQRYKEVVYVYQENRGLSAARNTGVASSKGTYLVFLDADDTLCPDNLQINVGVHSRHPEAAFVSGAFRKVDPEGTVLDDGFMEVQKDHYATLLQCNYIGMHAAVMYQRWVFTHFHYDETLKACEDYDLYLHVARRFPVIHHTECIANYLIHNNNMSGNISLMLHCALLVLKRQKKALKNAHERYCLGRGEQRARTYYGNILREKLRNKPVSYLVANAAELRLLLQLDPNFCTRMMARKLVPRGFKRMIRKVYPARRNVPGTGRVNLGDFNRTTPFSQQFGYDRGGPLDRYYIEDFLKKKQSWIRGRVLEIGDNAYTLQFGGSRVQRSDIFHVDDNNKQATFTGDLSNAPHLPDNAFDCIVLTQTLQMIYDYAGAIQTCYRILKPGGVLLLTVPGISQVDQDNWGEYWMWSFTTTSMKRILSASFSPELSEVRSFGNVQVASAFLYGLGQPEISREVLDVNDAQYQVIIAAAAVKPVHHAQ
ncbi:glycosyltransferase [Paraflavisolibacter sp. H34]|uniref:glycosyltransferase n=1 Tax=Huijunlia imazamoxiresistens TaxID=3127457 RepID=UPI003018DECB